MFLYISKVLAGNSAKMARNGFCFFAIVLIFSVVVADKVKSSNKFEEEMMVLLTKWREGAVQTHLFKLPSVKIIDIDEIDSYYNANGIKVTFSIGKMQLTGLDAFTLETMTVTQTAYDFEMTGRIIISNLTLHSDSYSLKGNAYYFYPIRGSGKMTIQLNDVEVLIKVRFVNVDDVRTKIDTFSLDFNITSVKANLEKSSFPINEVLNVEGPTILKDHQYDIQNGAWNYAVPYANAYLETVTLSDFIKTILDVSASAQVIKNDTK